MKQVYQWIQDLEDGVITPDARRELMEQMRRDPEVRQLYLQHMKLVSMLQETAETKAELGTLPVNSAMIQHARKKSALKALSFGLAAMVLLGLVAYWYQIQLPQNSSSIAVERSDDALLSVTPITPEHKGIQVGDKISIQQGLIRIEFPSGVEALIEGPSELELLTHSELKMDEGRAWFRVPEEGHGFTVVTDRMKVIDFGTEFGVWFEPSGELQVHVAQGKVRVKPHLLHGKTVELATNQAMRFDPFARGTSIPVKQEEFRRTFSKEMLYAHWSFDEPINGYYAADGTLPRIENFSAHLKYLGNTKDIPESDYHIDGKFSGALRMQGDGIFAETKFYGIGGNTPRTIAMWVRHREGKMHDGVRIPYVVWGSRSEESGATWRLVIQGKSDATLMSSSVGSSFTSKLTLPDEWVHVATVYTGKKRADGYPEIKHYVNGQEVSGSSSEKAIGVNTQTTSDSSFPVRFGTSIHPGFTGKTINGDIDEVFILRGAMTQAQIERLMLENNVTSAD